MRLVLSLLLLASLAHAQAPAPQPSVRLLVQSSPLAGYRYAEAARVWSSLRLGDALELSPEPDNPFDANAVRVSWRGHKLGYVPRAANSALAWAMGRGETLHACISRLQEHRNGRKRLEFEVFIE